MEQKKLFSVYEYYEYVPFMAVHHVHAQCLWRPEEDVTSPGTGITGGCEWSCGCWELNPGPWKNSHCS